MASGYEKDPNRVAGGYKATLHNPHMNEEVKARAQENLANMGVDETSKPKDRGARGDAEPGSSEYVPEDEDFGEGDETTGRSRIATGEHKGGSEHSRVMGGYKATLKNPNVSQEAKEHAEQVLKDNEAI